MSIAIAPLSLDVSLSVSDTPAPPLQFTLTAGIPGPAADLSPVLAAIAAAKAALEAAVAGVASSIDFGPVEAALQALQTALAASLDATVSSRATPANVSAAQAALETAIADIQDAVLQEVQAGNVGVQQVIANVHLPAQLAQIQALIGDLQTAIESALDGVLALLPPDVGAEVQPRLDAQTSALQTAITDAADGVAAVVNATSDAVSLNVATAKGEVLAALAAGTAAWTGEVRLFNNHTGLAPTGWTKLSGIEVPKFSARAIELISQPPAGLSNPVWCAVGQYLYVISGTAGALYRYDMASDTWATLASMPVTQQRPGPIHHVGGKLYVMGRVKSGASGTTNLAVLIYDIAGGTWTTGATLPGTARHGLMSFVRPDGKILAIGGSTHDAWTQSETAATLTNVIVQYDPATNGVSTLVPVSPARFHSAGSRQALVGSTRIVFNPFKTSDGTTLDSTTRKVYSCDFDGDNWAVHDDVPAEVGGVWAAIWHDGGNVFRFFPSAAPSSGMRARTFDYSASAGSQWAGFAFQDLATGQLYPGDWGQLSGGRLPLVMSGAGYYGLLQVNTAPGPWDRSFYAKKN